ncbi:tyrosine-type recombinase/integrase [Methylophaga sp.]|uniref:tyrosine-type recombinase/integrase n=1 Tax=Methylophaga sp. TaxID=2024840 RepID=UPI003A90412D
MMVHKNTMVSNFHDLHSFATGDANIPSDRPVWNSVYADSKWIYELPDSPTYKGERSSSINWDEFKIGRKHHAAKYEYCLTDEMIQEIKIAAYIYAHFPNFFRGSKTKKTTIDGKTINGRVRELAKIGSHFVRLLREDGIRINSFSDISFEMLKLHASSIGGRPSHLKRALRLLAEETVQNNLPEKLQFSLNDIDSKSIYWGEEADYHGIPTLSDPQFLFLLSKCKQAIAEFKIAIGFEIHDLDITENIRPHIIETYKNIKEPLEQYLWEKPVLGKKKSTNYFRKTYGYCPREITELYKAAHKASMLIILMLTGMRDSETSYLKLNSLRYVDGVKYLVSKVVKQENESTPENNRWIAIPVVEDAYDILSYSCQKTGNINLFSSPIKIVRSSCLGYTGINTTLNRWINSIDTDGLFSNFRFSVHQCRETLAYQLAKHKVGLPFITKQLKHFHNRFNRMPNSITAGYGDYKKNLFLSIESRMAEAREEVLMDVFGEDKSFAGGGGPYHKSKIDAWFKGVGLYGEHRKKYIRKMAESNISFMPTSIGLCNHNFVESQDGNPPPPCYGDFSCDPNCPNHIISEGCASALETRQNHASHKATEDEANAEIWLNLANKLGEHVKQLKVASKDDG